LSWIPKPFKGRIIRKMADIQLAICPALRGDVHSLFENLASEAKKEILIANYMIYDAARDLLKRVCRKAKDKGAEVRVLTTKNSQESILDEIGKLIGYGNIRIRNSLHAKFAIFDRKVLFISSANFTASSTINNDEIAISVSLEEVAKKAVEYFEDMWNESEKYK